MTPSTLERVLVLLGDGAWHARAELEREVNFPDAWLRLLREKGYAIDEEDDRIRLADAPNERNPG